MSERVKIDFHDGHGNISDCWGVTVDGKQIGAFYIQVSEPDIFKERTKKIQFHFNSVNSGFHSHALKHTPQSSYFTLEKTLHEWDSEFTTKGEDDE